jgi:hypothetical protein
MEEAVFDNFFVLSKIEELKKQKNEEIICELQKTFGYPPYPDTIDLLQLHNKSISIHQSQMQKHGMFLENEIVSLFLETNHIPFTKQLTIDKDGLIIGNEPRKHGKRKKCYHIVDFVIGKNICVGDSITNYIVVSCKSSCRERWTQDDWSFSFVPKLYLLLTLSSDYPTSTRFREKSQRKIITCFPKKKDDRLYKLNYDDFLHEILFSYKNL